MEWGGGGQYNLGRKELQYCSIDQDQQGKVDKKNLALAVQPTI
jgi:hypothetical protein